MIRRVAAVVCALGFALCLDVRPPAAAQGAASPRAIRRDVPLTNAIRRAFEAGTRGRTGRPGPNYWQLQVDYVINARLDPPAHTITGTETITLHNNSPQQLTDIFLRLDHNIFRPLAHRLISVPAENTDGMVVTRISVNGEVADLPAGTPAGGGRGRGAGAGVPGRLAV